MSWKIQISNSFYVQKINRNVFSETLAEQSTNLWTILCTLRTDYINLRSGTFSQTGSHHLGSHRRAKQSCGYILKLHSLNKQFSWLCIILTWFSQYRYFSNFNVKLPYVFNFKFSKSILRYFNFSVIFRFLNTYTFAQFWIFAFRDISFILFFFLVVVGCRL